MSEMVPLPHKPAPLPEARVVRLGDRLRRFLVVEALRASYRRNFVPLSRDEAMAIIPLVSGR